MRVIYKEEPEFDVATFAWQEYNRNTGYQYIDQV